MARRAGPAAQVQGVREGGALWISVQNMKNVQTAKEAMERVAGIQVTV
jgi:hypothetical protein